MEKRARVRRGAAHIFANMVEGPEGVGPYRKFTFALRATHGRKRLQSSRVAHLVLTEGACLDLMRRLIETI